MRTLLEYAKGLDAGNIGKPFVEEFARSSDVLEVMPFEGLDGAPVYEFTRQANLPTIGFRAINESSTTGTGVATTLQEPTFIVDHDLDVDRAIVDRYGPRRRAEEEKMAVAAAGKLWLDTLLKGDNSTNPRVFNGLQKRSALYSRTIVNNAASGGGALSLTQLDRSIANTQNPTHIIADFALMPRFIAAARNTSLSGFVIQTWDEVGKPKMSYGGLPILWGYGKSDHGSMLPFSEVASGGGGAVTTSIYVVSFREGGLFGIQIKPMEFQDIGLLENRITYRTHMSWDVGLVDKSKYCLTRLSSITDAAIVA